ncbi:hypothetical protein LC593_18655 [Nostoc sp. CHAB 5844]|nr:hypothetical protein [Nostoc sp. CHAB 5844]
MSYQNYLFNKPQRRREASALGRQCRGVSVAIFDVGASAVRWGDSTVVRQRGLGGFPHERLPTVTELPRMVSRLEVTGATQRQELREVFMNDLGLLYLRLVFIF